jgi:hypothetical protein
MGMGYGANFTDMIEAEELKKIAPQEWKALEGSVKGQEEDLEFYLSEFACGNEEDCPVVVGLALEKFKDAVYKKTGMEVDVGYHNSEDQGDRYDEVEGVFWAVDNAYIPNPQIARGFQQKIERRFFVTYG